MFISKRERGLVQIPPMKFLNDEVPPYILFSMKYLFVLVVQAHNKIGLGGQVVVIGNTCHHADNAASRDRSTATILLKLYNYEI